MRTTISLDDDFSTETKRYCANKGYTFSGLVKALLKEKMEREPIAK